MNAGKPLPYSINSALAAETVSRTRKDFESFGLFISFSGNTQDAYRELMEQLIPFFERLLKNNRQKLMQVLYRIDISESKLSGMTKKFPRSGLPEIIAHLVIEREMQKVITGKVYGGEKPGNG